MHSATLYAPDGKTEIARVRVTDDATVEIRMVDGYILFSKALQELGYEILHERYPVTQGLTCHGRTHALS